MEKIGSFVRGILNGIREEKQAEIDDINEIDDPVDWTRRRALEQQVDEINDVLGYD